MGDGDEPRGVVLLREAVLRGVDGVEHHERTGEVEPGLDLGAHVPERRHPLVEGGLVHHRGEALPHHLEETPEALVEAQRLEAVEVRTQNLLGVDLLPRFVPPSPAYLHLLDDGPTSRW